jgi:hypothetical protein
MYLLCSKAARVSDNTCSVNPIIDALHVLSSAAGISGHWQDYTATIL